MQQTRTRPRMGRGSCIAALRTLCCHRASAAVGAARMIEGGEGERKVVRDMWKIRWPSRADISVTPKRAGVWGRGWWREGERRGGEWVWGQRALHMEMEMRIYGVGDAGVWVQRAGGRVACGMRHGYVVEGIWTVASGLSGRDAMGRDVDGAVALRALAAKSGVLDDG
ncbi:hypothetical protein B0H14DRAFT_2653228 [Mycena olivaceomarginata]|nr:hypothetical protein B0H14DRAFT_2653228 [Mycena olivaceomarginata]